MKLRKYKKRKFGTYISFIMIMITMSLVLTLFIINYFSIKANEILYPMAVSETRKVVTMLINSACDEKIINNNLYNIVKDDNDEIKMINYNSYEATKIINIITYNIEEKLRDFENGEINYYGEDKGIIAEIPFGVVFGNSLFNNFGPKIKLRLNLLGDIMSNIETEVKPYGINNAYVEVRINLTVTAKIILPFVTENVVISNVIPLSMNIVQGNVPEGYITSYK